MNGLWFGPPRGPERPLPHPAGRGFILGVAVGLWVGRNQAFSFPGCLSTSGSASPWDFPGGLVVSLRCEFSPWSGN